MGLPYLNLDDAQAESRFKQLNEAYEVLGDLEKRTRYDDRQREANRRVGQQTKAQPTSNQWNGYSSRPIEQPINIEWIAAIVGLTLAILLVHCGANRSLAFRSETSILSLSKDAGQAAKPVHIRILRQAQDAA